MRHDKRATIRLDATYIRIDAIEHTLQAAGLTAGTMGYAIECLQKLSISREHQPIRAK